MHQLCTFIECYSLFCHSQIRSYGLEHFIAFLLCYLVFIHLFGHLREFHTCFLLLHCVFNAHTHTCLITCHNLHVAFIYSPRPPARRRLICLLLVSLRIQCGWVSGCPVRSGLVSCQFPISVGVRPLLFSYISPSLYYTCLFLYS
jgi:hypothetical protein